MAGHILTHGPAEGPGLVEVDRRYEHKIEAEMDTLNQSLLLSLG